jgi:hypothetical protein
MKNLKKIDRKKIIAFLKRDPLLTLVIIAVIILLINILISFISSRFDQQNNDGEVISEKAAGTNLKPSDFPSQSTFLRILPEYNEYFGISSLPLTKDENLKVMVELYNSESRKVFDEWIKKFPSIENIEFIFLDSDEGKELGFSLARSKYSNLIALLPYYTSNFTISGRFDNEKGVKFKIFYSINDEVSSRAVEQFMNSYNLYKESLTIEYMGEYLEGLDYRD